MSHRLTLDGLFSIMPSMTQPLLTGDEVAKILKVSRSYAYLMLKRGELPVVHVGKSLRVRPEDLEGYLHSNAVQGNLTMPSPSDGE